MLNRVILIGRLTRDAEKATLLAPALFTLAVEDGTKDKEGKYSSSFVHCKAFAKTADVIMQYTSKGSKIAVEGRLHQYTYVNKDKKTVSNIEILIDRVVLLDTYEEATHNIAEAGNDAANVEIAEATTKDDLPF